MYTSCRNKNKLTRELSTVKTLQICIHDNWHCRPLCTNMGFNEAVEFKSYCRYSQWRLHLPFVIDCVTVDMCQEQ